MRITSSEIRYSSQHTLVEEHRRQEELVAGVSYSGAWESDNLQHGTVRTREQVAAGLELLARLSEKSGNVSSLQDMARQVTSAGGGALQASDSVESVIPLDAEVSPDNHLKIQLIQAAVEAFSGPPLHIFTLADLDLGKALEEIPAPVALAHQAPEESGAEPTFGLRYHYQETHYERETTAFHAEGGAHTRR